MSTDKQRERDVNKSAQVYIEGGARIHRRAPRREQPVCRRCVVACICTYGAALKRR